MHALVVLGVSWVQIQAPLDPEVERATFRLPQGFAAELVLCEPQARKVVDIAFDDAGRMWATTACEYPLDGNEDSRAAELYARGGRDQVLIVDRPWEGERRTPRVFADGLAMPMSVLPLENAAIVQHGSEILRLDDTDGDGRADRREALLSGFGIQDSHLMPHRFLRAPDGWIYMAQGAFNSSSVVDRSGRTTRFDHCKLARFTLDGARFEVIGVGLNNIWGMVFDERGEFLIQEANDMGFGIAPFVFGATYPGIGQDRYRAYAPVQPTATELRFGGTGLSGLALTTSQDVWPAPYVGAVFVANPIERKVQAVRRVGAGLDARFELLPELLTSSDSRFRPVAAHFGPDDSLYVVDWYNPIISHNEVPRTHPDRDRERTRVWRIRAESAARFEPPDLQHAAAPTLLAGLESKRQFVARASWRQIVDRRQVELAPELRRLALDAARPIGARSLALWCLEGLRLVDADLAAALLRDSDGALRRAAVRGLAASGVDADVWLALAPDPLLDTDLEVRCEALRAFAPLATGDARLVERCLRGAPAPDEREVVVCEQDRTRALTGASLAAARERMWRRVALEGCESALAQRLASPESLGDEDRALAALALDDERGAAELARLFAGPRRSGQRELQPDELALCTRFAAHPTVLEFLTSRLRSASRARETIDQLLAAPSFAPNAAFRAALIEALEELDEPTVVVRAASKFGLAEFADVLDELALSTESPLALRRDALRALTAFGGSVAPLCAVLVDQSLPGDELASEALLTLSSCNAADAIEAALERIPDAPPLVARAALARVGATRDGAEAVVTAALASRLDASLFDERSLETLRATLAEHERGPELLSRLATHLGDEGCEVLVLSGGVDDFVDTNLALAPPFTLEAWVQLADGIDNRDGLLAQPGRFDFNFAGAHPRLYLGPEHGDVIVARRAVEAGRWTHVACTVGAEGRVRVYIDGELDSESHPAAWAPEWATADGLDIGRTTPGGAELALTEARVWSTERSARELAVDARRAFDDERPAGLELRLPGDAARLSGAAHIERRRGGPELLDSAAAGERAARFERFAELAGAGDATRGRVTFERTCLVCHSLAGSGESVGPPLDGVGARGIGGILAAVLEPSSAVESGYRELRVEFVDGTVASGLLVRSDDAALTFRPASAAGPGEARIVPRAEIARLRWSKLSVMPDGLLEALPASEAGDLLAYLLGLR